jgi:hypothetical protein
MEASAERYQQNDPLGPISMRYEILKNNMSSHISSSMFQSNPLGLTKHHVIVIPFLI